MFSSLLFGVICLVLAESNVALNVTDPIAGIQTFEDYKREFGKSYENETLEAHRRECFEQTLRVLDSLRKKSPEMGFGINSFSDLCEDEFNARFHRISPSKLGSGHEIERELFQGDGKVASDSLESIDYRDTIRMEVYDQENCDSSYVFAAVGVIEAHLAIHKNIDVALSKQHSMDCANKDLGYISLGCIGGGKPGDVFDYIQKYGTLMEKEYPYLGEGKQCPATQAFNYPVKSWKIVYNVSERLIMTLLKLYGPVSAVINAGGREFREYRHGIINDLPYNTNPSHTIMIVGYGYTQERTPYWICKNSWGTKWGYGGYFHLIRGVNMRAINFEISFPVLH